MVIQLTWQTTHAWISGVSRWTATDGSTLLHVAVRTLTAGVGHTRIHTAFVEAVLVAWAVIVATALRTRYLGLCHICGIALDTWITLVAGWTTALRIMIACAALGIDTATFQTTRVQAAAM